MSAIDGLMKTAFLLFGKYRAGEHKIFCAYGLWNIYNILYWCWSGSIQCQIRPSITQNWKENKQQSNEVYLWKRLLCINDVLFIERWSWFFKNFLHGWSSWSRTFAIYFKHRTSRCIFSSSSLGNESLSSYSSSYDIIFLVHSFWNLSSFTLSFWEVCGKQNGAAYNKTDKILAL